MINSLLIVVMCLAAFGLAYAFYARFLAQKVLKLDPTRAAPSHRFEDGVDYVPSNRFVLFGHHFSTIAGLGPIVGPAIGVIWGWLPALLWVVLGTIFFGAVHDLSTLYLSMRHDGKTIGGLTEALIGKRARVLFLVLIFFILSLAMGVFAQIMGKLFAPPLQVAGCLAVDSLPSSGGRPEAVFPSAALIVIAMFMGVVVYKVRKAGLLIPTIIGIILMAAAIIYGADHPVRVIMGHVMAQQEWVLILLAYTFVASVLPVWILLQPRDYLNSFQLYAGLALIMLGVFIGRPYIQAEALRIDPAGAPLLLPFLFITIACGAISGFHNLVSSGTTVRQIDNEGDARFIGYGGMLTEGVLAVGVIVACTAVLSGGAGSWLEMYESWGLVDKRKLSYFIEGSGGLISNLGVGRDVASTFIAVMCVSFAMTTLDSATRLLRYNIEEIGQSFSMAAIKKALGNRFVASGLAVAAIAYFALLRIEGQPVGMVLWVLFGTTNQLLAGLGLLLATIYLYRKGRPVVYTMVPMVVVFAFTLTAVGIKLYQFFMEGAWSVFWVGLAVLVLAVWLTVESVLSFKREKSRS